MPDARDLGRPILHHREFPSTATTATTASTATAPNGPPLLILHGLFGSSRNWVSVAQRLAAFGRVVALDLRNHGRSPHCPGMAYSELARDILGWLDDHRVERAVLLGHSMGGKAAMRLAGDAPERVSRLFVLDIAPVGYPPDPSILDALLALPVERLPDRVAAEQALAAGIPDRGTRLFLLTNLVRNEGAPGFRWQIPLDLLRAAIDDIYGAPVAGPARYGGVRYWGAVDFVAGGDSSYWRSGDLELARQWFPRARAHVLPGVGHNVHTDGGEAFFAAIGDWSAAG